GHGDQAHRHESDDEDVFATVLVTEMSKGDGSDRAGDITDEKNHERNRGAHRWAEIAEEQGREDKTRSSGVQQEVVHLDGAAEEAGRHCAATFLRAADGSRGGAVNSGDGGG